MEVVSNAWHLKLGSQRGVTELGSLDERTERGHRTGGNTKTKPRETKRENKRERDQKRIL
jgi:hypothetical protein